MPYVPGATAAHVRKRGRIRWWGWLLLVPALLILCPGAAWLVWLGVTTAQRNAALEKLRDAGIAVTYAELVATHEPVPEAENPAVTILAAAELIDTDGESWTAVNDWHIPEPAMTEAERAQWLDLQAATVTEQAEALRLVEGVDPLVRPAVDEVRADFGAWSGLKAQIESGKPLHNPLDVLLPSLNPVRQLAKLIAADARVAAVQGDDERALRQVTRLIGLSDAVAADGNTLVEYLVSIGIRALAAGVVREMSSELDDGPPELKAQVIALLLEERGPEAGYVQAIEGEITFQMEMMQALDDERVTLASINEDQQDHSLVARLMTRAVRPIGRGDTAEVARYLLVWHSTADAPTFPAATARIPSSDTVATLSFFDLFASLLLPSLERAIEAHYRTHTDRRLAAAALAIAWHRADHGGEFPESLEALVPRYLPAIPRDAMAADAPLRYDPARRILWSAGTDGVDDNGDPTSTRGGGEKATHWDGKDAVVELE
jgi:hypothetical protein